LTFLNVKNIQPFGVLSPDILAGVIIPEKYIDIIPGKEGIEMEKNPSDPRV